MRAHEKRASVMLNSKTLKNFHISPRQIVQIRTTLRFKSIYVHGSIVSIDETMITSKGKRLFQIIYFWKSAQISRKDIRTNGY
jgi:hypothetical protein